MRKIKLYKYPQALPHIHDQIKGYEDSVPFSEAGIEKWCELVDPKDAEFFYGGQLQDHDRWKLARPDRFKFLKERPTRHIFDIEGDQGLCGFNIHPDYQGAIFTAMNAEPNHRNWNLMVRPGCSMLLKDLIAHPRTLKPLTEAKAGFFFRGQGDPAGVRLKLIAAFSIADVPGNCEIIAGWNAPTPAWHNIVQQYEAEMTRWTYALCPAGYGQATQRYLEAVMLGRIPIVIADNLFFEDDLCSFRLSTKASVEQLARSLQLIHRGIWDTYESSHKLCHAIRAYFADPTRFMLNWMERRGILDNHA